MAPLGLILDALARQRGYLFPWVPVCLAVGVGGYFALPREPDMPDYGFLAVFVLAGALTFTRWPERLRPVVMALMLVGAGVLIVGMRAQIVAEPVLGFRYYGPIEGRIIKIDRSQSDKMRLLLDNVVLSDMAPEKYPTRVRVSLHGPQGYFGPEPGLTVMLTGFLAPPSGPAEPGGFDFQRMAWFDGLGAVGYTRSPVLTLRAPETGRSGLWVHRMRMAISQAVQRAMPGEDGAFAAAIMTGDRSGISQETLADLRASNLAHLLAISGLHMGLLTGFIFAAVRFGFALVPFVALRISTKKLAAVVAMAAGAFYLVLSGGNVATERAFIMVSVMFVAILFDRRALTLRAVALAAMIVLVLQPEAMTGPGFQMSFAATTGLVAVFAALRDWQGPRLPKWARPVAAVVISSAIAGLATAPVAAAHFNRIADYGLLANLLSVPLMGVIVMPGAVLAACLAPFGLAAVGLALMKPAIHWILGVADFVSGLSGALTYVPSPGPFVLPVFALGMLWLILWQGRARLAGIAPAALAFVLWAQVDRPGLLISDTGGLLGLMTPDGRALNKPRGEGFAASSWLENDGDGAVQTGAAQRGGFKGERGTLAFDLGSSALIHLSGRGAADRVNESCKTATMVILAADWDLPPPGCTLIDRGLLRSSGAMAVYVDKSGLNLISARVAAGRRLWNSRDMRGSRARRTTTSQ